MGHSDAVCDLFSFAGEMGGLLVSISCDGHLRVWDLVSEKFEKKFLRRFPDEYDEEGNVKRMNTLDFIDHAGFTDKIIYCTYPDGAIYAWNMKSGELVYTFQGHDDKITAIIMINATTFATCSYDNTVVIWDSLNGVSTHVFKFENPVKHMVLNKNFLFLLIGSNEVSIIDLKKNVIVYGIIFEDHTISTICSTEKIFLFADAFSHIYSIKTEDFPPLS